MQVEAKVERHAPLSMDMQIKNPPPKKIMQTCHFTLKAKHARQRNVNFWFTYKV